jgi:FKBP-type peptidyl-prolyl cis-trans isomerase FklB
MKARWVVALAVVLLASQVCAQESQGLKSEKEKLSYGMGMEIANNLKRQSFDLDVELFMKGLKDALSGGKTLMTEKEARETLMAFQKEMMAKQRETAKVAGEKNKKEGEAFLAENKKKEGVTTLPSGLQYKVIKPGTGKKPSPTDKVKVNYRGTLIDGTEFDSSYKRGEPASFQVKGVIPGWTEALQLMEEGAKWQLFIPSNLAYGERGAGASIGPNATLVFEVELISIQ